MSRIRLILMLIMGLCGLQAVAAVEDTVLVRQVLDYYETTKREKILLHTDRDTYMPGDSIWFRAYLYNLSDNLDGGNSNFIYVDLYRNNPWLRVKHLKIKRNDVGIFANNIALNGDLTPGEYTIVAYSRYMLNFPPENLSYTAVYIGNKDADNVEGKNISMLISLRPEGGHFVGGSVQKIGVRVHDNDSFGVIAEITVADSAGVVLCRTVTDTGGYGLIEVENPRDGGLILTAETQMAEKVSRSIPSPERDCATLRVMKEDEGVKIAVLVNGRFDLDGYNILIRASGVVMSVRASKAEKINIPLSILPDGYADFDLINMDKGFVQSSVRIYVESRKIKCDVNTNQVLH